MKLSSIYASINIVNPFLEIAVIDFNQINLSENATQFADVIADNPCTNKIYVSDNENSHLYEIDG
jgi:2-keto-4-pentenoate hydratase